MRISDWSSDVCSSDLRHQSVHYDREYRAANEEVGELHQPSPEALSSTIRTAVPLRTRNRPSVISTSPTESTLRISTVSSTSAPTSTHTPSANQEWLRVGQTCASPGTAMWTPVA